MITCRGYDLLTMTHREVTPEGYLVAPRSAIARTGVQRYRAHELGLDAGGMDPMRLIRLHRPAEEVFSPASMASFESKPITIGHPPANVTAQTWADLAKGEVRDVACAGDLLTATLIIKAHDAIEAVQSGTNQLSNGYEFELDVTPGTTSNGEPYDGIQRNIRGNHVAIVDAARCGSACRIADSHTTEGGTLMPEVLRKMIVDGIPIEVSDAVAAVVEKLQTALQTAITAKDTAEQKAGSAITVKVGDVSVTYTGAELAKVLAAKDAEITGLKRDVLTPAALDVLVVERTGLLAAAKRLVPAIATDGKICCAIRREVLEAVTGRDTTAKTIADAVLGGVAIATAEPALIRAAFTAVDAAMKAEDVSTGDADLSAALVAKDDKAVTGAKPVGRAALLALQANAWRGAK